MTTKNKELEEIIKEFIPHRDSQYIPDLVKAVLDAGYVKKSDITNLLKKLSRAVRNYADIGGKQFNQDEKEFWDMCETNDEIEKAIRIRIFSAQALIKAREEKRNAKN